MKQLQVRNPIFLILCLATVAAYVFCIVSAQSAEKKQVSTARAVSTVKNTSSVSSSHASATSMTPSSSAASHGSSVGKPSSGHSEISSVSSPQRQPPKDASAAELRYFDDAVFAGDSVSEGILYYDVVDTGVVTSVGASTYTALTNRSIPINGNKNDRGWMPSRIAAKNPSKIYLLFGANDLCWGSQMPENRFLDYYGRLIQTIRVKCPSARMYVQSIFPIAAKAENSASHPFDNAKIDQFNQGIKTMCANLGVKYVNVASALKGPDGKLPPNLSDDGMHLRIAGYKIWFNYLIANQ